MGSSAGRVRWLPVASLLACLVWAPGCYLSHVAGGQLEILCDSEPITDVLEDPLLDARTRETLELVLDVRAYAIETIGLDAGDNYTDFCRLERPYAAWNVSASPPDVLAPYVWSFPIVGAIPYLGFFDPDLAREEAERLAGEGYESLVLPVPAYSTLGWFDDPFFSSMLEDDPARIVEVIIHELTHATIYINGDAEFNETLATFVGVQGALDYLAARGRADLIPSLLEQREDGARFSELLARLREDLDRIFSATASRARKLELKRAAYEAFREDYRALAPQLHDPERYAYVLDPNVPFNNPLLLMIQRYEGKLDRFEALHARLGGDLARTVEHLRALAEEDDPRAALAALADAE